MSSADVQLDVDSAIVPDHAAGRRGGTTWPLLAALVLLAADMAILLSLSLARTDGRLTYALDDPYIHMAVARSVGEHGVWGITPHAFTSCESSVIWPLMLAGLSRAAPMEFLPLALNLAACVLLLVVAWVILRTRLSAVMQLLTLSALAILTPLAVLCMAGMEHLLHAALCLVMLWSAAKILAGQATEPAAPGQRGGGTYVAALAASSLLAAATRYETLFLLAPLMLLMMARRRWLAASLMLAAVAVPIVAIGLYSRSKGWHFLPNSLLLKSQAAGNASVLPAVKSLLANFAHLTARAFYLWPILVGCALLPLLAARRGLLWRSPGALAALALLGATLLHLCLASVGWFFRYEAYLLAMGIVVLPVAIAELCGPLGTGLATTRRTRWLITAAVLLAVVPLAGRAAEAHRRTATATANIYQQQIQMARFVAQWDPRATVALNDVGAVSFRNDIRCVDLWGLADLESLDLRRQGRYDTQAIGRIARERNVDLVIVYDKWFEEFGGLPGNWVRLGRWRIPNNIICGDDTVSFYTPQPHKAAELRKSLHAFAPTLPAGVQAMD